MLNRREISFPNTHCATKVGRHKTSLLKVNIERDGHFHAIGISIGIIATGESKIKFAKNHVIRD